MSALLDRVLDARKQPVIAASVAVRGVLVMALVRLGSLNGLVQTKEVRFWKQWLGTELPSVRTIGRIGTTLDLDGIRDVIWQVYTMMKRNKAIRPVYGDIIALIIDGHEPNTSYVKSCSKCLTRTVHTAAGDITQYYHRYVLAQLWCGNFTLCLDMEPQRPGEDEVAAALRLLERVCMKYPRAFTLVLGDGLYARASVFVAALKRHKHVIAVLKDERRDVLQDAYNLMQKTTPVVFTDGDCQYECWDVENLTTWDTLPVEARVVRSRETTVTKNKITKCKEAEISEWAWATDLSQKELPIKNFVLVAHGRWKIENNGFNELGNHWKADHVYCHEAMEAFWLIIMLAYNLFHAFLYLNVKPQLRQRYTKLFWASVLLVELLASSLALAGMDTS